MVNRETKPIIYILLLGIILVSSLLSSMTLSVGHNWGDDFASYIMQAQSIILGDPEEFITHNTITIENSVTLYGPITAPWGLPLLLVPILYFWGTDLIALKMLNIVFFALFLLSSYFLLVKRLKPTETLLIIGVLAFHPMLLLAQDSILTDIPHLFFATICILIIDNLSTTKKTLVNSILLGLLIFVAYEIRTAGLLLLVITLFCQLFSFYKGRNNTALWKRKYLLASLVPYLVFFVMVFIFSHILPDESNYINQIPMNSLFQTVANSFNSYFTINLPSIFFHRFIFWGLLPFCLIGMVIGNERDLPLIIYVFLTLALNSFVYNQQGGRYLYPIMLFLIYFTYQGIKASSFWIANKTGIRFIYFLRYGYLLLFVLGALFLSIRHANQNLGNNRIIYGPYSPTSVEMFDVIKNKTNSNSIIGFYKPRVMRMITHRDSYTVEKCEKITSVDYYVINLLAGEHHQVPPESLNKCQIANLRLAKIFENTGFVVYKINP